MICLDCDGELFKDAEIEVAQSFRGETFLVKTPGKVCVACGYETLSVEQIDDLRRRTADAYRYKHNLLSSDEIRAFRSELGMNQQEFAAFLSCGVASVKRWETWLVQDKSSDELIREKCRHITAKWIREHGGVP